MSLEHSMRAYLRQHGILGTLARLEDYATMQKGIAALVEDKADEDRWERARLALVRAESELRSALTEGMQQ